MVSGRWVGGLVVGSLIKTFRILHLDCIVSNISINVWLNFTFFVCPSLKENISSSSPNSDFIRLHLDYLTFHQFSNMAQQSILLNVLSLAIIAAFWFCNLLSFFRIRYQFIDSIPRLGLETVFSMFFLWTKEFRYL